MPASQPRGRCRRKPSPRPAVSAGTMKLSLGSARAPACGNRRPRRFCPAPTRAPNGESALPQSVRRGVGHHTRGRVRYPIATASFPRSLTSSACVRAMAKSHFRFAAARWRTSRRRCRGGSPATEATARLPPPPAPGNYFWPSLQPAEAQVPRDGIPECNLGTSETSSSYPLLTTFAG